jgi:hypothetical protein
MMNLVLYKVRRTLLKLLVPEFVWPKSVLIDGAEIKIRGAPYSFGVKKVLRVGDYEVDERRLLAKILDPGDVVVEMGGSIGILTAIIAAKVGRSGFVISVEASAELAAYSKTWLESGKNVRVLAGFGFPVWELKQPVEIQKFEAIWGSMSGRLTFRAGQSAGAGSNGASQPVYDLKTLSEYCERPPTTLVVDIEGSESIICNQKPQFPRSLKKLLIELHPGIYDSHTKDVIIRRIEEDGFRQVTQEDNVFLFARP